MTDHDLLRQFIRDRDERAFGELVRRHIDLVYSAARRQFRDAGAVEDAAQKVFIQLAEKANTIRDGQALAGWLLVTTRFVALNMQRERTRRRLHEQKAGAMKHHAQSQASSGHDTDWESIQPALDEAVAQLKLADRDALTLRYFQNLSLSDVGAALGISQRAAQKRIHRAIDRLRRVFAEQGIVTLSAESLTVMLAKNAVDSAPQTMAAQICRTALSSAAPIKTGIVVTTLSAKVLTGTAAALVLAALGGTIAHVVHRAVAQQIVVAPSPTTQESWRAAFDAAYSLNEGALLKRIRPPHIPERRDFFASLTRNAFQPDMAVFSWDGRELKPLLWGGGSSNVGQMLENVTGIRAQYLEMPRDMVLRQLGDDWIVRSDASQVDKAAAFAELADDIVGRGMTLVPMLVEREAIVARGKFKYARHPDMPPPETKQVEVEFFTDKPGERGSRKYGGGANNPDDLIQSLGTMLLWPVVTEIEPPDDPVSYIRWTAHVSANHLRSVQAADADAVDRVLATVARQTSLMLKREPRTVMIWRLMPKQ